MSKFSASMLAVLGYFLMALYFIIGMSRLMEGGNNNWLIGINFGTSVIWGMTGTLWIVAARNATR